MIFFLFFRQSDEMLGHIEHCFSYAGCAKKYARIRSLFCSLLFGIGEYLQGYFTGPPLTKR